MTNTWQIGEKITVNNRNAIIWDINGTTLFLVPLWSSVTKRKNKKTISLWTVDTTIVTVSEYREPKSDFRKTLALLKMENGVL